MALRINQQWDKRVYQFGYGNSDVVLALHFTERYYNIYVTDTTNPLEVGELHRQSDRLVVEMETSIRIVIDYGRII